jgi:hypothetical protein
MNARIAAHAGDLNACISTLPRPALPEASKSLGPVDHSMHRELG